MTRKEKLKAIRSVKGKLKRLHIKIMDLGVQETDSAADTIAKCMKVVNLAIKMRLLYAQARMIQAIPTSDKFQRGGMQTVGDNSKKEFIINKDGKLIKI